MVAQIDEQHAAMVADAVAPAGKPRRGADMFGAQRAAGMGPIAMHHSPRGESAAGQGRRLRSCGSRNLSPRPTDKTAVASPRWRGADEAEFVAAGISRGRACCKHLRAAAGRCRRCRRCRRQRPQSRPRSWACFAAASIPEAAPARRSPRDRRTRPRPDRWCCRSTSCGHASTAREARIRSIGPLGIKPQHPAAMQFACPYLSVLVGHGFVEIDVRGRRRIFADLAAPSHRIPRASRRGRRTTDFPADRTRRGRGSNRARAVQFEKLARARIHQLDRVAGLRRRTAGPEVPVGGDDVVVGASRLTVKGTRCRSWPVFEVEFLDRLVAAQTRCRRPVRSSEIRRPPAYSAGGGRDRDFDESLRSTGSNRTTDCAPSSPTSTRYRVDRPSCGGCRAGRLAGVGGTWCSVTMPVRGSSMPMNGVRWLEYQILPFEVARRHHGRAAARAAARIRSPQAVWQDRGGAGYTRSCASAESGAAHPRQPVHHQLFLLQISARIGAIDERGAGMMEHPEYHEAPAPLVVLVPHDLLVGVAAVRRRCG